MYQGMASLTKQIKDSFIGLEENGEKKYTGFSLIPNHFVA